MIQVYDAIAAECMKQQIYVHLDNHMSKGSCFSSSFNCCFLLEESEDWELSQVLRENYK